MIGRSFGYYSLAPTLSPSELLDMMESRTNTPDINTGSAAMLPTEGVQLLPLEYVTWRARVMLYFSDTDEERLDALRRRGVRYESFETEKEFDDAWRWN
jgi:hypothetical protein